MSDSILPPATPATTPLSPLAIFAAKTGIVALVVTISLLIVIGSVITQVDAMIDKRVAQLHSQFGGREFWEHIEKALDRAARPGNEMPPERQQQLVEDIRILADRARPFARAAATAFDSCRP